MSDDTRRLNETEGDSAAVAAPHAVDETVDPEASPALPAAGLAAGAAVEPSPSRPFSRRATTTEIWSLSWPVMLSQVLVTAVGLIDIAMVGRLGPKAVAAVGYATQFYFLAQSALFAVGFACIALMARAIGGGDRARARQALAASVVVAVLTAIAVAVVVLSAPRTVLGWLNAEPAVIDLTIPYLRLILGSSILLAVSMTLESGLRADKDTVTPMRIAAVVTAVKIGLNALLIFGLFGAPRLELVGAGLATLISQIVGVTAFVVVLSRAGADSAVRPQRGDLRRARSLFGEVVRIAVPGVAERVILNLALLVYFAILGRYGTAAVAAYTVGVRILAFSWIPGTGFGAATATLVGQALGADRADVAERTGWLATRIALVTAIVLGLLCAVARGPLARIFTDDAATIAALGPFMLTLALAQPMLQTHFTLGGAHRGAGDTWTPLIAAAVGTWGFRVPLALLFSRVLDAGLVWVWAALVVDHFVRSVWLALAFRRGRWRHAVRGPGKVAPAG